MLAYVLTQFLKFYQIVYKVSIYMYDCCRAMAFAFTLSRPVDLLLTYFSRIRRINFQQVDT